MRAPLGREMTPLPSQAQSGAELSVAGWREWIHLPELGLGPLVAKLDTGARTSALHAEDLAFFERDGLRHVRFRVPLVGRRPCALARAEGCRTVEAPVLGYQRVRNSGGIDSDRVLIETPCRLGDRTFPIQLTLVSRARMQLPVLLGRRALGGRHRDARAAPSPSSRARSGSVAATGSRTRAALWRGERTSAE